MDSSNLDNLNQKIFSFQYGWEIASNFQKMLML